MSDDPIRVLFVHHAELVGGAAESLLCLLRHLDPARVQAHLLAPQSPGAGRELPAEFDAGVSLEPWETEWSLSPLALLGQTWRLARLRKAVGAAVRRHSPQIIHANTWPAAVAARCACPGVPLIWHVRDVRIRPQVLDWLRPRCAVQIAISRTVEALLTHSGFAPSGIRVVYNGIDRTEFRPTRERAQVREELGLPPEATVFCSVARPVPWKRQDLLLRAAAKLAAQLPTARFLFVGAHGPRDLEQVAVLEALAGELGIADRVLLLGYRADIADVMAACDVFWHAAPDEPFGRSILEAMTLGMPIIAPNAGGAAELVAHGSSGLLFAADNLDALVGAALKMAQAPEFARAAGSLASRRAAESFSAGRMADGVLACYDALLGRQS